MVIMLVTVLKDIDDLAHVVIVGDDIEDLPLALEGNIVIGGDLVLPLLVVQGAQEGEEEEALQGEVVKAVIEVVEALLLIKKIRIVEALVKKV